MALFSQPYPHIQIYSWLNEKITMDGMYYGYIHTIFSIIVPVLVEGDTRNCYFLQYILYLSPYNFSHHKVEKKALHKVCVNDEIEQTPYKIILRSPRFTFLSATAISALNLQRMDNLSNKYLVPKCQLLGFLVSSVHAILIFSPFPSEFL